MLETVQCQFVALNIQFPGLSKFKPFGQIVNQFCILTGIERSEVNYFLAIHHFPIILMAIDVPTCGYWLLRQENMLWKMQFRDYLISLGHGPKETLFRNDLHLDEQTRNNVSILLSRENDSIMLF